MEYEISMKKIKTLRRSDEINVEGEEDPDSATNDTSPVNDFEISSVNINEANHNISKEKLITYRDLLKSE